MSAPAAEAADRAGVLQNLIDELPTDRLAREFESFMGALAQRAVALTADKVGAATEWLANYAEHGGSPVTKEAVAGARAVSKGKSPLRGLMSAGLSGITGTIAKSFRGGGGDSGGDTLKVTNIVEQIDVGVPVNVAYNLWTQFEDFPTFMKKVENVSQEEAEKLTWKAQVFWSHRTWRSTIVEQVPDKRIIWKSEGDKGYVDGAITFHEIAPELTRILVVLEYHPQGFFEHTGNLWRAQGRRVRLELKHYRRHIMTRTILHPDEVEGWRGEIRDGQVVRASEDDGETIDEGEYDGEYDDQDEDEYDDQDEDTDEYDDEYDDQYDEPDEARSGDEPPTSRPRVRAGSR